MSNVKRKNIYVNGLLLVQDKGLLIGDNLDNLASVDPVGKTHEREIKRRTITPTGNKVGRFHNCVNISANHSQTHFLFLADNGYGGSSYDALPH